MTVSARPISGLPFSGTPVVITSPIFVSSTVGMLVGDTIQIMLDNGTLFMTKIASILASGQIKITSPLPARASAGNIVIDLTQATIVAPSRAELVTDLNG